MFNEKDYTYALEHKKVIFLYFCSEWNAVCKTDQTTIREAFNRMTNTNIIGFKLDYDDANADDLERAIAAQFNIKETHTKLILKNGTEVQRSTSEWNINNYITQITRYLN